MTDSAGKPTVTPQEIFDRVARHLLTQGRRSQRVMWDDDDPACAYRGADGTSCAVGCLIPDESYSKHLEGGNVFFLEVQAALPFVVKGGTLRLLQSLQTVHDCSSPERWPAALLDVAARFNLNPHVLDSFESPYQDAFDSGLVPVEGEG